MDRQQFFFTGLEPTGVGQGLAFRAMAVAARVIGRPFETAIVAALEMPA
jgi:hypothetical protein